MELVITRGGGLMKIRRCIVCQQELHPVYDEEQVACTDCRDNEPPDQDNMEGGDD